MKTIREWLSEGLSPKHYELISKCNPTYDWDRDRTQNLYEALLYSTSWRDTQEGYYFWHSIYVDMYNDCYNKHSNNIFLKL